MQRTLASFHSRAPPAVAASAQRAARTPATLFAAMLTPVPVQQQRTPHSASPSATHLAHLTADRGPSVNHRSARARRNARRRGRATRNQRSIASGSSPDMSLPIATRMRRYSALHSERLAVREPGPISGDGNPGAVAVRNLPCTAQLERGLCAGRLRLSRRHDREPRFFRSGTRPHGRPRAGTGGAGVSRGHTRGACHPTSRPSIPPTPQRSSSQLYANSSKKPVCSSRARHAGTPIAAQSSDWERVAAERVALRSGGVSFGDFLAAHDWYADANALTLFSHWITPPSEPRRYNTHFFFAIAPPDQAALADASETHDGIWIAPQAALERRRTGSLHLVYPTIKHLERLQAYRQRRGRAALRPQQTRADDRAERRGRRLCRFQRRWRTRGNARSRAQSVGDDAAGHEFLRNRLR